MEDGWAIYLGPNPSFNGKVAEKSIYARRRRGRQTSGCLLIATSQILPLPYSEGHKKEGMGRKAERRTNPLPGANNPFLPPTKGHSLPVPQLRLQDAACSSPSSSLDLKACSPHWELLFDLASFKSLMRTQRDASESFIKSNS